MTKMNLLVCSAIAALSHGSATPVRRGKSSGGTSMGKTSMGKTSMGMGMGVSGTSLALSVKGTANMYLVPPGPTTGPLYGVCWDFSVFDGPGSTRQLGTAQVCLHTAPGVPQTLDFVDFDMNSTPPVVARTPERGLHLACDPVRCTMISRSVPIDVRCRSDLCLFGLIALIIMDLQVPG